MKIKIFTFFILTCILSFYACNKEETPPSLSPARAAQERLSSVDSLSRFAAYFRELDSTETQGARLTLFAPVNSAFNMAHARLAHPGSAFLRDRLPDSSYIKDYIVKGIIDLADIKDRTEVESLSGRKLIITVSGGVVKVGGVVVSDTVAVNTDYVIYSINGLLNYQERIDSIKHWWGTLSDDLKEAFNDQIGNKGTTLPDVKGLNQLFNLTAIKINMNRKGIRFDLPVNGTATFPGFFRKLDTLVLVAAGLGAIEGEGLINLTYLKCDSNALTGLDVSNLSKLKYLSCEINKIENIELKGINSLETIVCNYNKLTHLNLKDKPSLKMIRAYNNPFDFNALMQILKDIPSSATFSGMDYYKPCDWYPEISSTNGPNGDYEGSDCDKLIQYYQQKFQ